MATTHLAGFTTAGGIVVPVNALVWSFTLAGGPGGQHVNKVASKATLEVHLLHVHGPAAALERVRTAFGATLKVSADHRRSQMANRRECLALARTRLEAAEAPPPPRRKKTAPTKAATQRRLDDKRRHAKVKQTRRAPKR